MGISTQTNYKRREILTCHTRQYKHNQILIMISSENCVDEEKLNGR